MASEWYDQCQSLAKAFLPAFYNMHSFITGNVIDVNTSLKTLDLSWNHLRGSGAIAIAKGLENNCSLHTLLLAWNGFGDDGACAVAEALLENNTLQELDLSNNRITRKGCFALADALRVNTSLKILRIGKNQLGGDGAHALLSAIQGNEETSIELLDMDGVVIEQQTQPILSKLVKCKPHFDISCVFSKSGIIIRSFTNNDDNENSHNILNSYIFA